MLRRIRFALEDRSELEKFSGITTMDESFIGGKNKNRHADKKVPFSQVRSYKDKTPVFGIINNGYLITRSLPDTKAQMLKPLV